MLSITKLQGNENMDKRNPGAPLVPITPLVECKFSQPLWKTVWRFRKNLKLELPYNPAISLLGIYPKETKTLIRKDICTPVFIGVLLIFNMAKIWKEIIN